MSRRLVDIIRRIIYISRRTHKIPKSLKDNEEKKFKEEIRKIFPNTFFTK